jgi:hypothetical protein
MVYCSVSGTACPANHFTLLELIMKIRTDDTLLDVVPLGWIFDQQTDTWFEWDELTPATVLKINTLYADCQKTVEALRQAVIAASH